MYMGQFEHSLDAKGRIIIPSRLRESLGERFYITRGLDRCLYIYDEEGWQAFIAQLEKLPSNSPDLRKLVWWFVTSGVELEPDKQGRVVIPAGLRTFAGIEKDVVFAGVGSHVEVWDQAAWAAAQEAITLEEINRIAADMGGSGMSLIC